MNRFILAVLWGSVAADCPARNIEAGQSMVQRKKFTKKGPDVIAEAEPLAESAKTNSVDSVASLAEWGTPSEKVGFKITYLETKLKPSEVEPIVKSWVYWDPSSISSFFNYVDDGFCNVLINAPPAKGWKAKGGEAVFTFCGREKFEEVVGMWDKDSEKADKKDLGDLEPPPITVAGNTITLVEDWYGGPDVNGGKPVKETVVMVLNEKGKVGNIVYSVDNPTTE